MLMLTRSCRTLVTPVDRFKPLAPSLRRSFSEERVANLCMPQLISTSTMLGTQITFITWSRLASSLKTNSPSVWTCVLTRTRLNSMLTSHGDSPGPRSSRLKASTRWLTLSSKIQTKASMESLKTNTLRRMLVRLCTWLGAMMSMRLWAGWLDWEGIAQHVNHRLIPPKRRVMICKCIDNTQKLTFLRFLFRITNLLNKINIYNPLTN